jgi:putative nucleotidyltransferase with HDIG domain
MAATAHEFDPATARLLADAYERRGSAPPSRERSVEALFALVSLAGALALPLLTTPRAFSLPLALMLVVAYALAYRVEFPVGDGIMVPSQLIFVPLLLLVPTALAPALVCAGTLLASGIDVVRGNRVPQRLPLAFSDAAFALAPAATLILLDAETPAWSNWPAYVAALSAQFAADAIRETARGLLTDRMAPKVILAELLTVFRVDALLAPLGLLAAIAATDAPATALLVLPLVSLLAVFAREREARIHQTIELGHAYRGTALLLRDLLEEDDEYTGHHTEEVVELTLKVAERLQVDETVRRDAEMGALLHDIGKIHIPDAILNKPGALDDDEWAVMKTHTVIGQQMLDRVGGVLSGVGVVVRASHERFDGRGYPDGLAGTEIPFAARMIIACDSFNAMTTDRPYRAAMPLPEAVAELRRCSGTQFDPDVVDALLAVVGASPDV